MRKMQLTEVLRAKVESGAAPDNGFAPAIYCEIAARCNEEVPVRKGPLKTGDMVSTHYHYVRIMCPIPFVLLLTYTRNTDEK